MKSINIIKKVILKNILNSFTFRGHTRSIKAKKNIVASFIIKGLSILINLAYVPLLINVLGAEEYGIWLVIGSFLSWMNFFDIGIANGLRNKLAEALAKGKLKLAKIYLSTTYALISLIFIPLALLPFLFGKFINWLDFFNSNSIDQYSLNILVPITLALFSFRFVLQIVSVVLLADQKPALNSLINLIANALSFLIILILSNTTLATLLTTGIILSLIPILTFIAFTIFLFNTTYKEICPSFKFIRLRHAKELLGLGFNFFIIQISGLIIFSSTNFIITQFYSPQDVTTFNIAFKYFGVITMTFGIILTPMWSAVTEAYHKRDFEWIKNIMHKFKIFAIILTILSIVMLLISDFVYSKWIGNKITIPFSLSFIICIQTIVYTFASPYVTFLNGTGKIKLVSYLVIIQSIIYLPIVYILIKHFNLGVFSIVLASLICELPLRIAQPYQYSLIINNKAKGIWNK